MTATTIKIDTVKWQWIVACLAFILHISITVGSLVWYAGSVEHRVATLEKENAEAITKIDATVPLSTEVVRSREMIVKQDTEIDSMRAVEMNTRERVSALEEGQKQIMHSLDAILNRVDALVERKQGSLE